MEPKVVNITLNSERLSVERGQTVDALLKQLSVDHLDRIAIAVNDQVVRKMEWQDYELQENDQVVMIAPIQGG